MRTLDQTVFCLINTQLVKVLNEIEYIDSNVKNSYHPYLSICKLFFFSISLDCPSKVQIPAKSEDEHARREWLHSLVKDFLRQFVFDVQETDEMIEQVNRLDRNQREGYTSRICGKKYQGDAWRVR